MATIWQPAAIVNVSYIGATGVATVEWEPLVFTPITLLLYAAIPLSVRWAGRQVVRLRTPVGRRRLWQQVCELRPRTRGRVRRSWVHKRVLRRVSYELVVVGVGGASAVALALVSPNWVAGDEVPVDFFAAAAQINPVFVVAFAIELRMVNRLGMSENAYAAAADEALGNAVKAQVYWEDENPEVAREFEAKVDSHRELRWVWNYTEDATQDPDFDLAPVARKRYRTRRGGQAVFAIAVIASVVGGQAAALGGLSQGGAAPCSTLFRLTIATLGSTMLMVVLGAMRDLVADAFGARRRT